MSVQDIIRASSGSGGAQVVAADPQQRNGGVGRAIFSALADAELEKQRYAFLARAGTCLAASLLLEETVDTALELAVPALADWCILQVNHPDPAQRLARAFHRPPRTAALQELVERCYPFATDEVFGIAESMRTGSPQLRLGVRPAEVDPAARDEGHRQVLRALGVDATLCIPLIAAGPPLGFLLLVASHPARVFGPEEMALASDFARCVALALDNAQRFGGARRALDAREAQIKVMSHELRNPLHSVLLAADRILAAEESEVTDPRIRQRAHIIQRAARQMERQLGDLVELDTMVFGQLHLQRSPCDVRALLQDGFEVLAPLIEEKSIHLVWEIAQVEGRLLGDRARIFQVLSNLVGNAIAFTPARGIIRIRAERQLDALRVDVIDSGPGIPAAHQARIFEPYWQGQPGHHRGSGLGLTISKAIVEAHGGQIWVESRPGEGCTVSFSLPLETVTNGETGSAAAGSNQP